MALKLRREVWGEPSADWSDLEGEANVLSVNDLFVPGAALFAVVYFFTAGNLAMLLLFALLALFAFNIWLGNRARDQRPNPVHYTG
jgi:hypothetical protein